MKFIFNSKARAAVLRAIKHLENVGAGTIMFIGSFGPDPRMSALVGLGVFIVCRVAEVIVSGLENDDPAAAGRARRSPSRRVKASKDDDDADTSC